MTVALSVTSYGCSSSSSGRRGTGGAAGATANAGTNSGGTTNNGGSANNGGANNNGGAPNMNDLASMVKKPMASMDTDAPEGVATLTDATQAGNGGDLVVSTAQAGDEGDSLWESQEDIDGDGVLDDVTILVDDETGDKYVWYDTVIAEFCSDGSDANSTVILAYSAANDAWTMFWDSDCPEDAGLIYGCDLDAEGNATACGTCTTDPETETLVCEGASTGGDGDIVPEVDAGGGGGGDGDVQPPIVESPYACQCAFDCDGFQDITDVGGYCAESLGGAEVAVQADCEALFLPEECATLVCECACEATVEFSCEEPAAGGGR